jgi:hypothetical protein
VTTSASTTPATRNAHDQPVRNGTTFECTVEISGQEKTVPIRVLNEKPEFEVGAPR